MLNLNLIKGGIYSVKLFSDRYFIFIKSLDGDKLLIFKIKTKFNNFRNILNDIEQALYLEDYSSFKKDIFEINKVEFLKEYDGFVGIVTDPILKKLTDI